MGMGNTHGDGGGDEPTNSNIEIISQNIKTNKNIYFVLFYNRKNNQIVNPTMSTCKRKNLNSSFKSVSKKSKPTSAFIQKLFFMLENGADNDVVSWSHSGDSFTVHSIQLFTKRVLPKYFNSSFTSFKRQLNYYGFQKLNHQPVSLLSSPEDKAVLEKKSRQTVAYRHDGLLFLKGRPDLLEQIKRTTAGVDPKVEAEEMKSRVTQLEDQVSSLKNELNEMRAQMAMFQKSMESSSILESNTTNVQTSQNTCMMPPMPRSCLMNNKSIRFESKRTNSDEAKYWSNLQDILLDDGNMNVNALLRACSMMSTVERQTSNVFPTCIEDDSAYDDVFGL